MRPRHNFILLLLLAILLLAACSPLRRTGRNQKANSTSVDRTEIRKAVHDILRESGTLSQTVVEFYPPVAPVGVAPQEEKDAWRPTPSAPTPDGKPPTDGATLPSEAEIVKLSKPRPPAIKRIVHTEISAERERETTSDSLADNDIHTTTHTELSDKVAEKPPAVTATLKWIAIALAVVAAIILLLKFPKIKLF